MELEILKEFGPWGVIVLVMIWFMKMMTRFMGAVEKNTRVLDRTVSIFDNAQSNFVKVMDRLVVKEKNE